MPQPAAPDRSAPPNPEHPQLLLLGYQGTLQPDPAAIPHPAASGAALPPQMAMLIEPLLTTARLELSRRLSSSQGLLAGEPAPAHAPLGILQQRLQEILTLPLATQLATADRSITLTEPVLKREYPALAPLLRQAVSEWVTASVTFLQRLHRDAARLAEWLGVTRLPPVQSVTGTTSDTHPGGHVVLRVVFHDGTCIYYKPRPVTGEWLWRTLIESVAAVEPDLGLPAARVLPGSQYGWMESLQPPAFARPPQNSFGDTSRYWRAAGVMLCLAYHVGLTDLHLGNLIATATGPAVIDAECLATPALHSTSIPNSHSGSTNVERMVQALIATGLLPGQPFHNMPDTSGFFGVAAPVSFLHLPHWSQNPAGQFHLTNAPACLLDHANSPENTSPVLVLPQLLEGYRQAAGALLVARKALLAAGSPWRGLLERRHAPRIVLRDTLTYALLLSQSLAPGNLRSMHRRRLALHRALQQHDAAALPKSLLRAELHSLLHLHIPRLVVLPGTRTLASSAGRPLAHGFAHTTAARHVIRSLETLSAESLESTHVPALLLAALHSRASSHSQ